MYGEEPIDMTTRPKKVYVFLNPEANNKFVNCTSVHILSL